MLQSLGISLILTLTAELAFVFLIGIRRRKDVLLVVLVNIMTNPPTVILYHLLTGYAGCSPLFITLALEAPVIYIEAVIYKKYGHSIRRPLLVSLFANLLSFATGYFLRSII